MYLLSLRPESAQQAAGKSLGLPVFTPLRASSARRPLLGADAAQLAGSNAFAVTGLMRTGELVLCRHKIITSFKARQYLNGSGGGGSAEVKGLPPETTVESEQVSGQVSQLEDTVSLCVFQAAE